MFALFVGEVLETAVGEPRGDIGSGSRILARNRVHQVSVEQGPEIARRALTAVTWLLHLSRLGLKSPLSTPSWRPMLGAGSSPPELLPARY